MCDNLENRSGQSIQSSLLPKEQISLVAGILLLGAVAVFAPLVFRIHLYEFVLVGGLAGFYFYLGARGLLERVSFLAIVSLTSAIFNPFFITVFARLLELPWVSRGGGGWSFLWSVFAIATGHISLRCIKRAAFPVWGKGAARAGLMLGYLSAVGWIYLVLQLASALAGMTG